MHVYTETNGGIGETLLHSRLSLLSIDIDCDRIGEQFPSVLYSVEKFVLLINSYNKNFREETFCGLALSTKYFF